MVELLLIHWDFIRRPTASLLKYVRQWPVKLGLGVYAVAMLSHLGDPQTMRIGFDFLSEVLGVESMAGYYAYNVFVVGLNMVIFWYAMPPLVRWISPIPRQDFDSNLYRKLVFFSPMALVIVTIVFSLPLKILTTVLVRSSIEGMGGVAILLVVHLLLGGVVAVWASVASVMWIVITWKGLRQFFALTVWQIILVEFVIPAVIFCPIWIALLPRYFSFLRNYLPFGG